MISASLSLSLPRFGWKSTSMPRSLKICTAADDRASEMRTLGMGLSIYGSASAAVLLDARLRGHDLGGWNAISALLRRLRQRGLGLGIGPVEPDRERLDVGALDRRATPDEQAGRRLAIGVDAVGDAFLLERRRDALDELCLRIGRKLRHRRIDHLE